MRLVLNPRMSRPRTRLLPQNVVQQILYAFRLLLLRRSILDPETTASVETDSTQRTIAHILWDAIRWRVILTLIILDETKHTPMDGITLLHQQAQVPLYVRRIQHDLSSRATHCQGWHGRLAVRLCDENAK